MNGRLFISEFGWVSISLVDCERAGYLSVSLVG